MSGINKVLSDSDICFMFVTTISTISSQFFVESMWELTLEQIRITTSTQKTRNYSKKKQICSAPKYYCMEVLVSDLSYVICELFTVTHKHTLM